MHTESAVADLTESEKREIVMRLARFEAIGEIVADFRHRGLELHHKQVGAYDPSRAYFEAGDWARELFNATRKTYVEDASDVPIANRAFRLKELQAMFLKAKQARNWKLAAVLIEQASKEASGAYTNTRVAINDSRRPRPADLSPEERQQMLAGIIRKAMDGMRLPNAQH